MRLGTSGNSSHLPTFSEPEDQYRDELIDISSRIDKLMGGFHFPPKGCLHKNQKDLKNQIDK